MKPGLPVTATSPVHISYPPQAVADLAECRNTSDVHLIKYCENLEFYDIHFFKFMRFEAAMDMINSTESGHTLLNCIEILLQFKSEKLLVYLTSSILGTSPLCSEDAINGRGTGSCLHCNFELTEQRPDLGQGMDEKQLQAVILYHELVHVLHNLQGERIDIFPADSIKDNRMPLWEEEFRTIGLDMFSAEDISENKFRGEIGVPLRISL